MITIQIAYYCEDGEEMTEVVAVQEMTFDEFNVLAEECDVYDDGGSHILVEYTQSRVDELIERNANGLDKLD